MRDLPKETALIQGTLHDGESATYEWIGDESLPVLFSGELLEQKPGIIDSLPWRLELQYIVEHPGATIEPHTTHVYKRYK